MCLTKLSNITVVIFGKHRWTVSIINIRKEGICLDLEYTTLDNSQQSGGAWWLVTNVQYAECGHWSAVRRSGLQLHTVTRSHATSHHLILLLATICFDRNKIGCMSQWVFHTGVFGRNQNVKKEIYHMVNCLRNFLSSCHPVIWSFDHSVIWSFYSVTHCDERTDTITIYRSACGGLVVGWKTALMAYFTSVAHEKRSLWWSYKYDDGLPIFLRTLNTFTVSHKRPCLELCFTIYNI